MMAACMWRIGARAVAAPGAAEAAARAARVTLRLEASGRLSSSIFVNCQLQLLKPSAPYKHWVPSPSARHDQLPSSTALRLPCSVRSFSHSLQLCKDQSKDRSAPSAVRRTPSWQKFHQGLSAVSAYVGAHGKLPPQKYFDPEASIYLRPWLKRLRTEHTNGKLHPEMAKALDQALGDLWRVRFGTRPRPFKEIVDTLRLYQQRMGRLPLPSDTDPDAARLSRWMCGKRALYAVGWLKSEHVTVLETLPGWTWRGPLTFKDGLERFQAFVKLHGRLPKAAETWKGWHVGNWMRHQRDQYVNGRLRAERIAALELVDGWMWRAWVMRSHRIPFAMGLDVLQRFVKKHGRLPHSREIGDDDRMHLASWVKRCRDLKKKGKLTEQQIKELEAVPGWWWVSKGRYQLLGSYRKKAAAAKADQ